MSVQDLKTSLRGKRRELVRTRAQISEMEDEITSDPSPREVEKMRQLKAKRRTLETEIGDLELDIEEAEDSTSEPPKDDPPKDDPPKDDPPQDDPPKDDPPKDDPPKDNPPKETPPVSEHWSRRKWF